MNFSRQNFEKFLNPVTINTDILLVLCLLSYILYVCVRSFQLYVCICASIYIYIYIHSEEEIGQLWELLVNLYVYSSQFLLATIQFFGP